MAQPRVGLPRRLPGMAWATPTSGLRWHERIVGPPEVRTFALAHALAALAEAMATVSLAGSLFFNVSADASRSQVLLYLATTMVPFAVLAPFIGPAIDRFRRGQVVIAGACYLLRAACCIGLYATLYDLTFYVVALVLLVTSKASGVIKQTLIPRLTSDRAELVAVNSALATVATIGGFVGLSGGAALLRLGGAGWLLGTAAAIFVVATLVMRSVRLAPPAPEPPSTLEYVELHAPVLLNTASGFMVVRAGVGFFMFMLAFSLRRSSEPVWVYGAAGIAYGVGSVAGLVAAPGLRRRVSEEAMMALSLVLPSLVTALAALGLSRPMVLATAASIGVAAQLSRQALDSVLQRQAPDAMRARTFARYETRFQLAWVGGAVAATAIRLPPEASMAVLAALFLPGAVVYVRASRDALRYRDPAPQDDPATAAAHRLALAARWRAGGAHRLAVVEAAGAVDLLRVSALDGVDDEHDGRLEELRRLALDPACGVGPHEADEALLLAERTARAAGPLTGGSPTPPPTRRR